jgi:predicted Fe-Mo cluster-binding NifX family protein
MDTNHGFKKGDQMRIAAVTDDGKTISLHFGRATMYAVFTVEDGQIVAQELRDKVGHRQFLAEGLEGHHQHHEDSRGRGFGNHSESKHQRMFSTITDCEVLLARGMGRGAYLGLQQLDIRPIVTEIPEIDLAIQAVLDGSIEDHTERLH